MRSGGRALLRGKRLEEDSCPGLSPGRKAVGSVPGPRSWRPQSSGLGVGVGGEPGPPALRVQARREETWPKESDSGTIRNSPRPGAFGQPWTPSRLLVPRRRGSSLGGAAGSPGGLPARHWSGKARHVAGSLPAPRTPISGPPFLDQVQARSPRRTAHPLCPLLSPPPPYIPYHLASSLFLCLFPTT